VKQEQTGVPRAALPWSLVALRLALGPLLLAAVFSLYAVSLAVPWIRLGRPPAYHAWSAKLAGLSMLAAGVALFGFGQAGGWLQIALALAALSHLDRLLIGLLLNAPAEDVPGFWAARPAARGEEPR
jgi:hypothetical protein